MASVLDLIGDTPLVEVTRIDRGPCRLFLKLESANPSGSLKDRPARAMIEAAEAGDLLFFSEREDGHITHVALSMGSMQVVHAAIGRGGHFLEDLNRPDDYGRELIKRFRFARRIGS